MYSGSSRTWEEAETNAEPPRPSNPSALRGEKVLKLFVLIGVCVWDVFIVSFMVVGVAYFIVIWL